jgi:radical SAM protein with 4Fe4S-binding SPASM domain
LKNLNKNNIYTIPVGDYFGKDKEKCYLVYAPLANASFISLPADVQKLEEDLQCGHLSPTLQRLLEEKLKDRHDIIGHDTFCTLHLLMNEKCNFHCKYCYSATGRSKAELDLDTITVALKYFLSTERKAVKDRTVMFMGGGEPVLSWHLVEEATLQAENIARENGINLQLALTTNGSIMTDEMLFFLKAHNFRVQISFEVLPDVQESQRGIYNKVARNINRICDYEISNYIRSTITELNVERIPEMVRHCQKTFPKVKKLNCQQIVDPDYFLSTAIVNNFFDKYFKSFNEGLKIAKETGLELISSSSHLIKYSRREKFCYNLLCLTPYGTFTTCPDVSSPNEDSYDEAVIAHVKHGEVVFDEEAFLRRSYGSIHTYEPCKTCWARWNCGSGCPDNRRVYSDEIFYSICDFYRRMLRHNLVEDLAAKYQQKTTKDFYQDIASKL